MKKRFVALCVALGMVSAFSAFVPSDTAEAATRHYVGSYDLKGTGQLSDVYNTTTGIEIEHPTGSVRRHSMTAYSSWAIMKVADVDGNAGAEIILSTVRSTTTTAVLVINEARYTTRSYSVANGADWTLLAVEDTNGQSGAEIIIDVAGQRIFTIRDASRTTRNYNISGGFSLLGIQDVNGSAGKEIVLKQGSNKVYVIREASYSTKTYTVGSGFSLLGFTDTNGASGQEIVIDDGRYIRVIKDATYSVKTHNVGTTNWTFREFKNVDSNPGNEILINKNGQTVIFSDSSGVVNPR